MSQFIDIARIAAPLIRDARPGRVLRRLSGSLAVLLVAAGCSTVNAPVAQQPTLPASDVTPARVDPPIEAKPATVDPLADLPAPSGRPAEPAALEGDLWDRIRAGFAMPTLNSPLVAEKERFYLQRPEYLQRMFSRGSRYLFHIVEEIEKRGMPTELALLPFVESAMNPTALSHAQASGLWQFIPSTGRAYNLRQDWWVDNRRDVVKSTDAALDYLQKIHAMHGDDWFLALASYNWGEGAVGRAVRRNAAHGLPTGYLSLKMPAETRNYVPKLLALKNILLRANELGVALPELPNRPYFVTIEKTRPIDLKLAAGFAGMTVDEFVALNPAHNRPVIAASRNNQIKLPADRLDEFLDAVERHGQANRAFATWQPHTIGPGETLETLAQRGGVALAELRSANDLRLGQHILPGTRILAPQRRIEDESRVEDFAAPRVYELVERPAVYHKVGRRETLASIARRYGTSVAQLRAWNRLGKGTHAGATLLVRQASSQTVLTTENGDRRVVRPQTGEPRLMHAVLRREAAPEPVATPEAARPAVRAGKHPARAAKSRSHARSKPRTAQATPKAARQVHRTSKAAAASPVASPRSPQRSGALRTGTPGARPGKAAKRT
ncbi:MAG: transglycosylase SLT domain-containing protein [Burkholderiaceae bacterium]|nr:transglycosylase SLT domain-containing protein [Burkholderiaceae bacterium]